MTDKREQLIDRSTDHVIEQSQLHLIFALTFAILLAGALMSLLLPWTWSRRFRSEDKRWFVGRAWEDAGMVVEFACLG